MLFDALDWLSKVPASDFTKIINHSTSPNKQLAVDLGSVDGSQLDGTEYPHEGRGGVPEISYGLESRQTYLGDVKANHVIGILDGGR